MLKTKLHFTGNSNVTYHQRFTSTVTHCSDVTLHRT